MIDTDNARRLADRIELYRNISYRNQAIEILRDLAAEVDRLHAELAKAKPNPLVGIFHACGQPLPTKPVSDPPAVNCADER